MVIQASTTTVVRNEVSWNDSWAIHATGGVVDGGGNIAYNNLRGCAGVICRLPDTAPPVVKTRTPMANTAGVAVGQNVAATFNEAVQGVSGSTFTLRSAAGSSVTGAVSYDAGSRIATLNPSVDLAPGTQYTATLTGGPTSIRDVANNPLVTQSWSFTTATPSDSSQRV